MYDDLFKKILIVEDDLSYRNPLRDFLSNHSYTVSVADDGAMAMEKLLFHKPNVVILDLMLPKVNGFDVLGRIRAYPDSEVANLPVIVLSNLSGEKDIAKAKAGGINYYLIKSQTTFDDVLRKVEEILFHGKAPSGPAQEVWDLTKV